MKRRHGQLFYGMAASVGIRRRHRDKNSTTTTNNYQPYKPRCPLTLNVEYGGKNE